VPESLKNVVLVMNAAGMLVPPGVPDARSERQRRLWDTTEERMARFLPGLLESVIPSPLPLVSGPVPAPTATAESALPGQAEAAE
jgi:golgi-specific brefeldin A-resistance guanine nucleotide exchange factor 1